MLTENVLHVSKLKIFTLSKISFGRDEEGMENPAEILKITLSLFVEKKNKSKQS